MKFNGFLKEQEESPTVEQLIKYITLLKEKYDELKISYDETEFDNELLQEKVKKLEKELEICRGK